MTESSLAPAPLGPITIDRMAYSFCKPELPCFRPHGIGLTKEYRSPVGGSKLAVNKLDLTMYSGQITALLGHNGAGKVNSSR